MLSISLLYQIIKMDQTQFLKQNEQEDNFLLVKLQENDPTENLTLEDAIAYYQSLTKAK